MDEPEIPENELDADAVRVLARLKQNGFEAYLVGGCVRDLLLGRVPKDFDIATSAHPPQVKELFRNCRLIGRRFRLAQVYFKGGKILEVSTFRKNPAEVEEFSSKTPELPGVDAPVEPLDGPENGDLLGAPNLEPMGDAELAEAPVAVLEPSTTGPDPLEAEEAIGGGLPDEDVFIVQDNVFGTELEDARRRDFTINGLFYDPADGVVLDYVNGLRDLAQQEIRTIGDPEVRMREDPVRLLRAVRFACKLNFDIESRTYAAMEGAVEDLVRCSSPRLLEETFRLIRGGVAAPALKMLRALDALKILLAPVDQYLEAEGPEAEKELWAYAAALDARVAAGETFDDAMLLAALLLPISESMQSERSNEGEGAASRPVEELLKEWVRASRLPRRIAERTRMLLLAQPILAGERRRRGGLMSFRRHPLFNEALKVFEVSVDATGENKEAMAAWKEGRAPSVSQHAPGPRRRKRRRRAAPEVAT